MMSLTSKGGRKFKRKIEYVRLGRKRKKTGRRAEEWHTPLLVMGENKVGF